LFCRLSLAPTLFWRSHHWDCSLLCLSYFFSSALGFLLFNFWFSLLRHRHARYTIFSFLFSFNYLPSLNLILFSLPTETQTCKIWITHTEWDLRLWGRNFIRDRLEFLSSHIDWTFQTPIIGRHCTQQVASNKLDTCSCIHSFPFPQSL
jgi:hypothetical protein